MTAVRQVAFVGAPAAYAVGAAHAPARQIPLDSS